MICDTIHIIREPEGEEEQGIENLIEKVMMENFPNLIREKVTESQETQRVPSKRNPKRPTARHIIIKMAKFQDKERISEAVSYTHLTLPTTVGPCRSRWSPDH